MELIQVDNFINGRYLLSNIKSDKNLILKSELLSSFSIGSLGSIGVEKTYYDTSDFFFAEKGINIYITNTNYSSFELIIRYDSEQVTRIEFLKNIPSFFKLKINKGEGISNYISEINDAIYKVYPTGLNVNIEDILRQCKPQIMIKKKRDHYRVVNNSGVKVTFAFDECEYINLVKKKKFKQPTLDIVSENYKSRDDVKEFLRLVIRDFPKLIKIESNELTVARNNLK